MCEGLGRSVKALHRTKIRKHRCKKPKIRGMEIFNK